MKRVHRRQLLAAVSCVLFLFSWSGCTLTGGGIHIGSSEPVVKGGGPPSHAPAHGYRAKHAYYYYPDAYVYFDISKKVYFYLQGDEWRMSASLPHRFRVQLGDHVQIELDSEKPYTYFDTHKKKYPPGQMKKKEKYVKKKK